MTVVKRIREIRRRLDMSQAQLAEKIGSKQNVICRLENGKYKLTVELLVAIADALGVSPASLLEAELANREGPDHDVA